MRELWGEMETQKILCGHGLDDGHGKGLAGTPVQPVPKGADQVSHLVRVDVCIQLPVLAHSDSGGEESYGSRRK